MPSEYEFPGWKFVGRFPDVPNGVGSWLLHNSDDFLPGGSEALLLEVPPGLERYHINKVSHPLGCRVDYVTASHDHQDHLNLEAWSHLKKILRGTVLIYPHYTRSGGCFVTTITLSHECVYLLHCPKHSWRDQIVVFRGVAMTGDIELGTLESVNDEVPRRVKAKTMNWLQMFQNTYNYHIHTVFSAHMNDLRRDVDWPSLFTY